MKVNFYLHNSKDTVGRSAIYLRYSHESEDFRASVKYSIDGGSIKIKPEYWIKSYQSLQSDIKSRKASTKDSPFRVRRSHPLSKVINARLDQIEADVYTICNGILSTGKNPFVNEVRNAYKKSNMVVDFFFVFDRFIEYKRQTAKSHTVKNLKSLGNELVQFNETHKININRLDGAFLLKFKKYLVDKNNSVGSIKVKVIRFKTFLNWALDNGLMSSAEFRKWKVPNQVAIHSALTPHEIANIMALPSDSTTQYSKDLLLFSCFTGLRRGEMEGLTLESEKNGILTFQTGKTKGSILSYRSIKLNELSYPIWERLREIDIKINHSHLVKMKLIAKQAGVNEMVLVSSGDKIPKWEDVASNTGRRTFITLSFQFGIPKNYISLIVGHKDKGVTSHYDKTHISKSFIYMDKWAEAYFKEIS